jgi:hypothetical protein
MSRRATRPASRLRQHALLLAALSLAAPLHAGEGPAHAADLAFGPLIGGHPVRVELRTTRPFAPIGMWFGIQGGPTLIGQLAPLGVDLDAPFWFSIAVTDATGRIAAEVPTVAGQFGPAGLGTTIFAQAVVVDVLGRKIVSNVEASEVEPLPAPANHLTDAAAALLPAGTDVLGGNSVEVADVDRDGHLDLLIATDVDVRIWRNDGTGAFVDETAARIAWPGDAVATLRAADLDADGDFDLLTGGGHDDFLSPPNRLWLNDGTGVFSIAPGFPPGEGLATQFEVADVNADGLPDVFVANGSEGHLSVPGGADAFLGNIGGGQFVEVASFATAPWNDPDTQTTGVRAGDVDLDGDLDLFLCKADTGGVDGTPGQPNLLLLNDGSGTFSDASATWPTACSASPVRRAATCTGTRVACSRARRASSWTTRRASSRPPRAPTASASRSWRRTSTATATWTCCSRRTTCSAAPTRCCS